MKSILMTVFCAAVLQFVSCSKQVKNVKSALISADEAKEIVAKEFEESDYHQQYYVVTSDKFDDRVYEISWGEPVLVRVIPDGKLYSEESYYYLLTGIMPTGQVLATQTVDAVTGKMLTGSLLIGDESDVLKLVPPAECIEYCTRLGFDSKNAEAVFYYDGTVSTSNIDKSGTIRTTEDWIVDIKFNPTLPQFAGDSKEFIFNVYLDRTSRKDLLLRGKLVVKPG